MNLRSSCLLAVVWLTMTAATARCGLLDGDGIVAYGDSMTMQYTQWVAAAALYGDDYEYDGTQFNWVDHLVLSGYNFGPEGNILGFPYNVYNAAVAGVSSDSYPGQISRVEPYLTAGEAEIAVLNIGANDFGNSDLYSDVYHRAAVPGYDPLSDPEVLTFVDGLINNIRGFIDGTLALDPSVRMILTTVPDLGVTPDYMSRYTNASQRAAVGAVFDEANARIVELAGQNQWPVVDLDGMTELLEDPPIIDGVQLLNSGGLGGDNLFLSDGFHPGTVFFGYYANAVLLANQIAWNDPVQLISDQTILTRAGLTPGGTTPTYQDISPYIIFTPVPEPSGAVLLALAMVGLLAFRRR